MTDMRAPIGATGRGGMVTAPHPLATDAGLGVLADGGNAVEAMVAMAAAISVAYPHMTGLGGDGFWLIAEAGSGPIGVSGCGQAARLAGPAFYADHDSIPARGPLAALTVPGTVAGWDLALQVAAQFGGVQLPLARLLAPAIAAARQGVALPVGVANVIIARQDELRPQPGFAAKFLPDGAPAVAGSTITYPDLADTLEQLARAGLQDFYMGDLAASMADELDWLGSPLRESDFSACRANLVEALKLRLADGTRLYNFAPPTQGLASLAILGIMDHLRDVAALESADWLHAMVEATRRAFHLRDHVVTDPLRLPCDPQALLDGDLLAKLAAEIDPARTTQPHAAKPCDGDTVWMGCVDAKGRAVSFIQSIYWGFGSGIRLKNGVIVQNRGLGFSLAPDHLNALLPGARPFHTLNPAMALLPDGRHLTYGTMGGEGQPQTQAAIFTRMITGGLSPAEAIAAPRWLWGRTWGAESTTLKLEQRLPAAMGDQLAAKDHPVEWVEAYCQQMGHAGAIIRLPDGHLIGGADPRADGSVRVISPDL